MGRCWWCHWGWPKQIRDIYEKALDALDGDSSPLHYGPAHIVWDDENWDSAQSCLDEFDVPAWYTGNYSDEAMAIVRQSLIDLLAVPDEFKNTPAGYDDENPEQFPPPSHWEMRR